MPNKDETAGLDFLDFLFTVAISVGLTPELLQVGGVTGLLSEAWQKEGRLPCTDELFNIGVFGLGFLNLTLSWFGYHASIRSRPLNYVRGYGMFRFLLDVVLVISYGIILIKFKSFYVVLALLLLVFIIFVVWDCLKIGEYWGEFKPKYESNGILQAFRREWVSVFSCALFVVLGIAYFCFGLNRWITLVLAILISFFYRFNKFFPTWERFLGVKNA
jgi:hypothetical protein